MADEGKTGSGLKIARLEKGKKDRTARHSSVMNEIIDAVNRVLALTVSPQSAGKFIWSDANGVLQIEPGGGSVKVQTSSITTGPALGELEDVSIISFDEELFEIFAGTEAGEVVVKPITVECDCDTEDVDGGDET